MSLDISVMMVVLMVSVAIGIVVIDGRVAGGSVGMVLVAHLLTKRIFFIALV